MLRRVSGVSKERWQEAQEAERGFWSTSAFGLKKFRRTVVGSMQTAEWALAHARVPDGDYLEVGIGPLGIGCTHFMRCTGELHTLDPIEPTPAEVWELPEPCRALVRACQDIAHRHVGQAEQIDFADDAFALVAMENMLDHVEDPGAVLSEARRVLMPGGCLILAVDTFSTLGEARFRFAARRRLRDTTFVRAHPHRFSSGDVLQIVRAAGFSISQLDVPSRTRALAGRHYRVCVIAS